MKVSTVQKARKSPGSCGKCKTPIEIGMPYRWWAAFRGPKQIACMKDTCTPTQADLTGSDKLARLYAAQEAARVEIAEAEDAEAVTSALETCVEVAREVGDEYREAADAFGGNGPSAERADNVEAWADELENAAGADEFDEDQSRDEGRDEIVVSVLAVFRAKGLSETYTALDVKIAQEDEEAAREAMDSGSYEDDSEVIVARILRERCGENVAKAFLADVEERLEGHLDSARSEHLENVRSDALNAVERLEVG